MRMANTTRASSCPARKGQAHSRSKGLQKSKESLFLLARQAPEFLGHFFGFTLMPKDGIG